jgi:hypothetical protein
LLLKNHIRTSGSDACSHWRITLHWVGISIIGWKVKKKNERRHCFCSNASVRLTRLQSATVSDVLSFVFLKFWFNHSYYKKIIINFKKIVLALIHCTLSSKNICIIIIIILNLQPTFLNINLLFRRSLSPISQGDGELILLHKRESQQSRHDSRGSCILTNSKHYYSFIKHLQIYAYWYLISID